MNRLLSLTFRAVDLAFLHVASLLVPVSQRGEWLLEWKAELWHVTDARILRGKFSWQMQLKVAAFCIGSFSDAFCLQQQWRKEGGKAAPMHSSATQCLVGLVALLVFCSILARLLPAVGAEYDTVRHPLRPNLILIDAADVNDSEKPAVSLAEFRSWKSSYQRYFDGLAFYRTSQQTVTISEAHSGAFTVALASANMMGLLGLPVRQEANVASQDSQIVYQAVLSYEMWVRSFGSDPRVAGRLIRIGARTIRIAGVLPCGSWKLPVNPDLWLLTPDAQLNLTSKDKAGYVVAHLTQQGQEAMYADQVSISVRGTEDHELSFYGVRISDRAAGPWKIYLFALILAVLALPAVTSISMGESHFSSHRPSWKQRLERWLFLAAKFTLVAAIIYFASLDIAYSRIAAYSEIAELVQLFIAFLLCLFGFRWALVDQSQRCPVCLRHVTHPARVGFASQTFLGWNGTEMMCAGGHTLLHIPSLPTSWFGAQRWLYLDTSWEFLFADLAP